MLEIIRENGGIDYIIKKLTSHVGSKRGAELSIAALVSMVNICTANNTVAILTVGNIAKKIGDKFGVTLSGYNLLTFTPYKWGDPETRASNAPSYPLQRTYTISLNVGF